MIHHTTTSFFVPHYRESVTLVVGRMIIEAQKPENKGKKIVTNFNQHEIVVEADSDPAVIVENYYRSFDRYKK